MTINKQLIREASLGNINEDDMTEWLQLELNDLLSSFDNKTKTIDPIIYNLSIMKVVSSYLFLLCTQLIDIDDKEDHKKINFFALTYKELNNLFESLTDELNIHIGLKEMSNLKNKWFKNYSNLPYSFFILTCIIITSSFIKSNSFNTALYKNLDKIIKEFIIDIIYKPYSEISKPVYKYYNKIKSNDSALKCINNDINRLKSEVNVNVKVYK